MDNQIKYLVIFIVDVNKILLIENEIADNITFQNRIIIVVVIVIIIIIIISSTGYKILWNINFQND